MTGPSAPNKNNANTDFNTVSQSTNNGQAQTCSYVMPSFFSTSYSHRHILHNPFSMVFMCVPKHCAALFCISTSVKYWFSRVSVNLALFWDWKEYNTTPYPVSLNQTKYWFPSCFVAAQTLTIHMQFLSKCISQSVATNHAVFFLPLLQVCTLLNKYPAKWKCCVILLDIVWRYNPWMDTCHRGSP